jgi:hypothetical protein
MNIKCSWCSSWINDFDQACPNCGGVNENFRRQGTGVPQTIAELKEWAGKHHLPLDQMRTYIGVNYTAPKAFGIYKDETTGNFIVYKNKADGTRAVRYEGPDDGYNHYRDNMYYWYDTTNTWYIYDNDIDDWDSDW